MGDFLTGDEMLIKESLKSLAHGVKQSFRKAVRMGVTSSEWERWQILFGSSTGPEGALR